jgi:RNA polymerase sigma factor (sigma-70 family)
MSEIALPFAPVPRDPVSPGRLCSDERLARLASAGSERALALLYERHHQALYRYCHSIVRDHEDAQDALQSTMTNVFIALRSSDRDLAVRPWLFRIAHNEAISILRKRRPNDCLLEEKLPSDTSMERALDRRERLRVLVADIQALPERQRAALLMRELSGLSIGEIAQALSVSPGAAKQTLFEARSSLHELAEGRAMDCETVRRAISDGDRRVLRARRIGSHLRGCADCRDFRALIDTRTADLRALAPPLPASAATTTLARLFADGAGRSHAGSAVAASGTGLGSHASASLLVKGLASAAILAAASAGTLHLVRDPAKHTHTSAVVAPVAVEPTGAAAGRTSATQVNPRSTVALPSGRHSIAAAVAAHARAGAGHGAFGSTGARPEASRTPKPSATPTVGEGKTGSRHIHGGASGGNGRRSHEGQVAPRGPKGSRSHRSSKPTGAATSPQPQGPSHGEKLRGSSHKDSPRRSGGGNGHTPQGQQAPTGKQPASREKRTEVHQPTEAPGTPPEKQHGASGK